jgi:ABC-type proline/glycine betaine transport system permease subunit
MATAAVLIPYTPAAWQDFNHPPAWLAFSLRDPVNSTISWLNLHVGTGLEHIKDALQRFGLTPLTDLISSIPWPVMVVLGVTAGAVVRSIRVAVIAGLGVLAVGFLGMWAPTAATVAVVGTATVVAVLIGFPLGVLMSENRTFGKVMRPVLDAAQTLPVFLWIIPAVMILGSGGVPGLIATVIYAMTPVIRYTYVALSETDPEVVDAARSLGATRWQVLWHVRVPLGLKTILIGINQCILLSLAMATISAFIGTPGLGQEILSSVTFSQLSRGVNAGTAMLVLAVVCDRFVVALARRVDAAPASTA